MGAAGLSARRRVDDSLALLGGRQIGFRQHDAVGHRRLLDRFGMRVEGRFAVDRIDHRHHAVEPVAQHQIRMRHGGV